MNTVEYATDHGRKSWRLVITPSPSERSLVVYCFADDRAWIEGVIDLPSAEVRRQLAFALLAIDDDPATAPKAPAKASSTPSAPRTT